MAEGRPLPQPQVDTGLSPKGFGWGVGWAGVGPVVLRQSWGSSHGWAPHSSDGHTTIVRLQGPSPASPNAWARSARRGAQPPAQPRAPTAGSPGHSSAVGSPVPHHAPRSARSLGPAKLVSGGRTSAGRERSAKCDYGPVSLPPSTPGPIYRGGGREGGGTGAYLGREIPLRP